MSIFIMRPNEDKITGCATFGSGTGHYGRLNEVTADDTNGIASSAYYDGAVIDRFGFADVTGDSEITSVTISSRAWGDTAATKIRYRMLFWPYVYFKNERSLTQSPVVYSDTWTKNPHTDKDWKWADLTGDFYVEVMLSGFKEIKGVPAVIAYCSQMWVEIDYIDRRKARIFMF